MTTASAGSVNGDGQGRPVSESEIRAELGRILSHSEFEASERLRGFLTFVVEESLAGRAEQIGQRRIARRVFDRGDAFDPGQDPVVRVEAGRLRRRLERYYYVAGEQNPIRIDIPKGRYAPRFSRRDDGRGVASSRSERSLPRDPGPTVAIVPFRNLNGDAQASFFGAGLVAELVAEVNRYERVVAVPAQSLGVHGGTDEGSGNARFLVEGSVRRDDVEMKIVVHLTDTLRVRHLWSESYKVPLDASHLIEVQEDLARDLMAAVADEYGVISRRLERESQGKPPAELSTYEALLRYHHYLLVMTPEAGADTFQSLVQATEREPGYGPAWAALANLHVHAWLFDRPGFEDPLSTALQHAKRGASLAPESQLARTILAYLHLLRGEVDRFTAEAEVALALNPGSPNYTGSIGYLFALAGEYDRGEALLEAAFASGLRQPSWFHHGLFAIHFARGRYEDAYATMERAFPPVGFWDALLRAAALGKLGRGDEARRDVAEVRRIKPDLGKKIEEMLARTPIPGEVRAELLDGLRRAGFGTSETV